VDMKEEDIEKEVDIEKEKKEKEGQESTTL
jgi:hypothetical protein